MKIAITGGTGFVGTHLADRFDAADVVKISRRTGVDTDDVAALARVFQGCDVVAHCAGINREIGDQTYARVHVQGTANVLAAARQAGVKKVIMISFLRARPNCGSAYHESKWAAEKLVRASGLDYTVVKAGMTFGRGDHMVDHLSHLAQTLPVLPTVGLRKRMVRPLPIDDLVDILVAAAQGEMSGQTIAPLGVDETTLPDAAQQVARQVGRKFLTFPVPVWLQYIFAQVFEWTMVVPLAAKAQVFILSEGLTEAAPWADPLPDHLIPRRHFTDELLQAALPPRGPFTWRELRVLARFAR